MTAKFTVTGLDRLKSHIDKMANAPAVFDADLAKSARMGVRELILGTSKKTGTTARGWSTPKKLGLSKYQVENEAMTANKKYSLVTILDRGRKEVVADDGKLLYIPLSERARAKKAGANIPKGFIFGVDYVLAKKSKSTTGTGFVKKANTLTQRQLTRDMIATIRSVHSGK